MVQCELKFSTRKKLDAEDQNQLVEGLSYGNKWKHTAELVESLGMTRRNIQFAVEALNGAVISGQKGYCLLSRASPEEAIHAVRTLRSQAAAMNLRAIQTEKLFHKIGYK